MTVTLLAFPPVEEVMADPLKQRVPPWVDGIRIHPKNQEDLEETFRWLSDKGWYLEILQEATDG